MVNKREKFLKTASVYFEKGLIREVFQHDDFSICNVANESYAVFFYPVSMKTAISYETFGPLGIVVSSSFVQQVSKNTELIRVLLAFSKDDLKRNSFRLGKRKLPEIEDRKRYNDVNGPSSLIDLSMEENLLSEGHTRN